MFSCQCGYRGHPTKRQVMVDYCPRNECGARVGISKDIQGDGECNECGHSGKLAKRAEFLRRCPACGAPAQEEQVVESSVVPVAVDEQPAARTLQEPAHGANVRDIVQLAKARLDVVNAKLLEMSDLQAEKDALARMIAACEIKCNDATPLRLAK